MPKYPRGMVKRRGRYYLRDRRGGADKLFALGTADITEAKARHFRLKGLGLCVDRRASVSEFSVRWLGEYVTKRTLQNQKLAAQRMRDHVLPVLGRKLMFEVTPADIRAIGVALKAKGLAPLTVRHVLSDVRCMFNYAAEEVGLIERSPFRGDLMPAVPERGPQGLSREEVGRVLRVVPPQHERLVRLALLTGLRYGEVRGLRWDAVMLDERPHLLIRLSHDGPTKTRKVRIVPLVQEAEALLREAPRRSIYVFPGRFGGMMDRNACGLNRIIKREVPGFTFQRLRHTFASRALEVGLPIELLRLAMGHSTVRMTEHYARVSSDVVWEKMRVLSFKLPETGNGTGDILPPALAEATGNR